MFRARRLLWMEGLRLIGKVEAEVNLRRLGIVTRDFVCTYVLVVLCFGDLFDNQDELNPV